MPAQHQTPLRLVASNDRHKRSSGVCSSLAILLLPLLVPLTLLLCLIGLWLLRLRGSRPEAHLRRSRFAA